jgi:hypothetical protein
MRIAKGERWVVACPETGELEIELLEEVFTHLDDHFLARITAGRRIWVSSAKRPEGPGDMTMLRTVTTVFRRQTMEAQR